MSKPSDGADADRNMLFGIFALQLNFISRDALVAAMNSWVLDKKKPLGKILLEQGQLTAGQLQALDGLISQHVLAQQGDAERSFRAIGAASVARSTLGLFDDLMVQCLLGRLDAQSKVEETQVPFPPPISGSRYRRLRHHVDGGLGKLFVAEDTELHREVALKEIKPEYADNADNRGRFVLEAEITGGLEHPGIVPVYGLGVYPNGRPYYAMRFIRGDSLRDAINHFHAADKPGRSASERSLAFRQLLRRFVDTCNAVAYAHSRGVLHRDLKPANIMLGKFGETLVVDWGLAKAGVKEQAASALAGAGEDERTLRPTSGSSVDATRAGMALGTLPFMSPEQAQGRHLELGPASDIYSLGATLYVLLTGVKPYTSTDGAELLAQVRAGRFAPALRVKPHTPPALDAICRKAMAFKPEERYASALELAADIEHWLADEPVAAYPEPWTTRLGRSARRHRTLLVAAAVLLVTAVVGLSISSVLVFAEQQKTAEQKKHAQENYQIARDLSFRSIELFELAEVDFATNASLQATRKEILSTASRGFRKYLEHEKGDLELQKRAAQVYRYAANAHRLENGAKEASSLYRESFQLLEPIVKQFPANAALQLQLANTKRDHANMQAVLGKLKPAAIQLEEAVQIARDLLIQDGESADAKRSLAWALLDLCDIQRALGQEPKMTAVTITEAVDLLRKLRTLPDGQNHPYDPLLLAMALSQLAIDQRQATNVQQAIESHREPTKILDGLNKAPTGKIALADIHHILAWCRYEQARTWAKVPDRHANAETNLLGVVPIWDNLAKSRPAIPQYRASKAKALLLLGELRAKDVKHLDDATIDFGAAVALLEKLIAQYPELPDYHADLGRAFAGLGQVAQSKKDPMAASTWFHEANQALGKAVELSPDNAQDRMDLQQVRDKLSR